MKLSEAILLGSVGTGQAFGTFLDDGKTCAMGAAMVGAGFEPGWRCDRQMKALFAFLEQPVETLPDGLEWPDAWNNYPEYKNGWEAIVALNNHYRWTRPQIAAWVATVEPQEDSAHVTREESCASASEPS